MVLPFNTFPIILVKKIETFFASLFSDRKPMQKPLRSGFSD